MNPSRHTLQRQQTRPAHFLAVILAVFMAGLAFSSMGLAATGTTTVVTSSAPLPNPGQALTFTATVTPASGPTGTVQFQIDGSNAGSPASLNGNTATYTTSTLASGTHSVVAVYSGNSNFSGSTSSTFTQSINSPPTVATAASATPSTITGNTTALSVVGADVDTGQSSLTYTWATTGTPPAAVSYSLNGTNAAQNTTATFSKAGTYNFQVTMTDPGGLTAASSVTVTVNQTLN